MEPINIMIWFKCAELEAERSKWLNTKLSVALYTYPQFLATPFLKTGNSPLPSKGAVRIFNPALLFTLCGIRKITTLARDHRPIAHQTRATKVGARHFPSLKILPGRLHRWSGMHLQSVLQTSKWGEGAVELRSGSHLIIRGTALVQARDSIVKNAGLAVPTSDRREAIKGSNVVQHAPLGGGPFC